MRNTMQTDPIPMMAMNRNISDFNVGFNWIHSKQKWYDWNGCCDYALFFGMSCNHFSSILYHRKKTDASCLDKRFNMVGNLFPMFKRTIHRIYSLQYCSKWSHYAINASDINSFFDDWINSTFNIPQSSITAACLAMERNSSAIHFRWHWKLMLFAQYPYIIQTLQLKMN